MARYEPDELPGCSTPHLKCSGAGARRQILRAGIARNAITAGDGDYRQIRVYCIELELELTLLAAGVAAGAGVGDASLISIAHRGNA